jgi:hypothetical protein
VVNRPPRVPGCNTRSISGISRPHVSDCEELEARPCRRQLQFDKQDDCHRNYKTDLEQISTEVLLVFHLQNDLFALFCDSAARLDLVVSVAAVFTVCRHDDDVLPGHDVSALAGYGIRPDDRDPP